ncbi:flagellar assembly protein A [Paenisporosarcina quisquiliarum]|uniref:flagellar assembly protein A n=1 Tax=Paenisporosarcina quisquiliarum TaxID=365346 RepID=UPI003735ADFD
MQPSITIKSETVEEAVKTALSILGAQMDEVSIAVLSTPSKGIFGRTKQFAEVTITKLEVTEEVQPNLNVTRLVDEMSSDEQLFPVNVENTTMIENKKESLNASDSVTEPFGLWIENGEIKVKSARNKYPILIIGKGVRVSINGLHVTNRQIVSEQDRIEVDIENEIHEAEFHILLENQNMEAYLQVIPGQRIQRFLEDTSPEDTMVLSATETILPYNELTISDVMQELALIPAMRNLDHQAIAVAINSFEEQKVLIAKGTYPIDGKDGSLQVIFDNSIFQSVRDQKKKVDFREKNPILTVEEGEIIAKIIPPTKGIPGIDLYGNVVLPKAIYEVDVRLTKHLVRKGDEIIAVASGRPVIEKRGRLVKVDIVKELVHHGDVSVDSGHIRFQGDVTIKGDIDDSMIVEAAGRIVVEGNITKASILSGQSVTVKKNVFSSCIDVGKSTIILNELTDMLKLLLVQLDQMSMSISQFISVNHSSQQEMNVIQLKQLIRLLMERKFIHLKTLVHELNQKVRISEGVLDAEWITLANRLNNQFMTARTDSTMDLKSFYGLIEQVREIYEIYCIPPEPKSNLSLSYAINSSLYCSGNIFITGQGAYHCNVQAGNNVRISNVCRGGVIVAGRQVILDELGSEVGVKTIVRVPSDGIIQVDHVYQGTHFQIGNRIHTFAVEEYQVRAHIGTDGMIAIR